MEQLLVLSVFTGWTNTVGLDGLEQRPYAGIVFTSRQNMWNVAIASKHQKEGNARKPIRSYCEYPLKRFFDTFFDYQLDVATCSIDHTQYIQTALKKQWPQVHVVSCAIHMLRNVHKHKSLLRTMDNYKVICTQIHLMRSARTWMQFHTIASVVLMDWETSLAEEEFAQWFQETYLLPPGTFGFSLRRSLLEFLHTNSTLRAIISCELVRLKYKCDCLAYHESGWLCAHTVACCNLIDDFRLKVKVNHLANPEVSGTSKENPLLIGKRAEASFLRCSYVGAKDGSTATVSYQLQVLQGL
ncbi:hypothetical protein H257_17704 [Aphanomyces astaci]|uniref:SWIM-type domain-containing protein n=1 Tax=Aphanomyces astaci TaxID=112090 RepID=W4FFL4_APHAT|nr:hypothetical protein H257_17704 [Aphanomyces astaci]ETV65654.1 hypothetical protein H257_17704 [Aphanomyces astaci]|eukprot:XP_009844893.1 hypothetical protein H257_17704 [Aphanomyces astaci]